MLAGFTHAPVVELSERLAALTGLGHAFYGSDGASRHRDRAEDERALLAQRAAAPARAASSAWPAATTAKPWAHWPSPTSPLFREAYAPLVRLAPPCRAPMRAAPRRAKRAADVARALRRRAGSLAGRAPRETAALIVEPLVQCAAGMAMHDAEYLRLARALCDRYEVHLVVDEIAVGLRPHRHHVRAPAGGHPARLPVPVQGHHRRHLPLSAVLTTDAVYEAFYDDDVARGFLHSHSYTGNPLACRAALATLEIFEQRDVLRAQPRPWRARSTTLFAPLAHHPRVRHARQLGMIWAWDVDDRRPDFARRYHRQALARGLLLRPIGSTLYVMPPYVLDAEAGALPGARRAGGAGRHAGREPRRMSSACFVTGTDTGVGKTLVGCRAAACAGRAPSARGRHEASGGGHDRAPAAPASEDALALRAASTVSVPAELDNPVLLPDAAVAAHRGARARACASISPSCVRRYRQLAQRADAVVVEGAGGFHVPLSTPRPAPTWRRRSRCRWCWSWACAWAA